MKISRAAKNRVAAATVRIPANGGRAILVSGGYILTAAHCITWDHRGGMVLGDWYVEEIETAKGAKIRVQVHAVEPVADLAVLGEPDNQSLSDDWLAFLDFLSMTWAVPLWTRKPRNQIPVRVWVYGKHGDWFGGTITRYSLRDDDTLGTSIYLQTDRPLEGGDSGSPVVDEEGRLVGVISNGDKDGTIPIAYRALPVAFADRILRVGRAELPRIRR